MVKGVPPFNPARFSAGSLFTLRFNAVPAAVDGPGDIMPSKKPHLKAYVSPEEYDQVAAQAGRASLSISAFVKAVCLGHEIKSTVDQDAILTLARMNGDLGRLGGLLKMALAERAIDQVIGNNLLEDIRRTRRRLEEKVRTL